jgi:hypothetical protein
MVGSVAKYFKQRAERAMACAMTFISHVLLTMDYGDMIEFKRGTYEHWAIYVGGGYIIHFTNLNDGSGMGEVREDQFDSVLENSLVRINYLDKFATKRGLELKLARDIVHAAHMLVGSKRPYGITEYNCEHFVTECTYGQAFSIQAEHLDANLPFKIIANAWCASSAKFSDGPKTA